MGELRRACRFTRLAAILPGLLLAEAFYAAECLGSGLGYNDVTGVAVAVERADDVRALDLADDADELTVPAERHGHCYLDLARAQITRRHAKSCYQSARK